MVSVCVIEIFFLSVHQPYEVLIRCTISIHVTLDRGVFFIYTLSMFQ